MFRQFFDNHYLRSIVAYVYEPEMLTFLDETGKNRSAMRQYGYSLRGKPPRSHDLLSRGEHIIIICHSLYTVKRAD